MKHYKLYLGFSGLSCFLTLILISLVGCTGTPGGEEVSSAEVDLDKLEAGRLRDQLDLVLEEKDAWHSHWSAVVGDFDSSDFELVMTDSIDPMEMPERNPILPGDPLFPYQYEHPGGNGTMDIFSYKIEAQESLDTPYLNPDSEVKWYRADGMKERLLFMGPSGMFEEGKWLNENEFIVLGYFQEELGFRPMAWIINVNTHRVAHFKLDKYVKNYERDSFLDQKIKQVSLN